MDTVEASGLLARARKGDPEAFRWLVERHQRLVALIVFRIVRDQEEGLELCQDVFLKVYQRLDSFRGEAGFSTWVGRIARNTALNHLRRRKVDSFSSLPEGVDLEAVPAVADGPEQVVAAGERQAQLGRELAELPEIDQTMLLLFHQEGLSYEEIGRVVALPVSGVKSHLFRARRRLRKKLGPALAPREAL